MLASVVPSMLEFAATRRAPRRVFGDEKYLGSTTHRKSGAAVPRPVPDQFKISNPSSRTDLGASNPAELSLVRRPTP